AAYFGQKDAQQTVVIKQLVRDLNLPVRIEVCETVREPDGLAMSSRNVRLSPQDRERAVALRRALLAAERPVHEGIRAPEAVNNGARFETYTIAGERGSGDMKVNGAAARLVHRGDTIIVISYGGYDPDDLEHYDPRVVHVDAHNEIQAVDRDVATLLRAPTTA